MDSRMTSWAVLAAACALGVGCGPEKPRPDGGPGCAGVCSVGDGGDGSPDGGTGQDDAGADAGTDAGTLYTLAQIRTLPPLGQHVRVERVVVHDTIRTSAANCQLGSFKAEFWVEDPRNPDAGIFVSKFCADPPAGYQPDAGDLLTLDGYLVTSPTENRHAYRPYLADLYPGTGSPRLAIQVLGTAPVPPPRDVDAGAFGNAEDGAARPNPEAAGTFVHIRGPLAVTDATPRALMKLKSSDGGLVPDGWAGFEVTGGILVVDNNTAPGCDWRSLADAGSAVVFPDGIRGAWDTYAHEPFCSPFPQCLVPAFVPGANDAGFTYALYPTYCARDLDGGVLDAGGP